MTSIFKHPFLFPQPPKKRKKTKPKAWDRIFDSIQRVEEHPGDLRPPNYVPPRKYDDYDLGYPGF